MAKWRPPHPARWIVAPRTCQLGQRFSSRELARDSLVGGFIDLGKNLKLAVCSRCENGYHVVTDEELFVHRNVLTEVPNVG